MTCIEKGVESILTDEQKAELLIQVGRKKMEQEKYRWINGHLYVLTGSGKDYVHCFHNARIKNKQKAIEAYEEALLNEPFED